MSDCSGSEDVDKADSDNALLSRLNALADANESALEPTGNWLQGVLCNGEVLSESRVATTGTGRNTEQAGSKTLAVNPAHLAEIERLAEVMAAEFGEPVWACRRAVVEQTLAKGRDLQPLRDGAR